MFLLSCSPCGVVSPLLSFKSARDHTEGQPRSVSVDLEIKVVLCASSLRVRSEQFKG